MFSQHINTKYDKMIAQRRNWNKIAAHYRNIIEGFNATHSKIKKYLISFVGLTAWHSGNESIYPFIRNMNCAMQLFPHYLLGEIIERKDFDK